MGKSRNGRGRHQYNNPVRVIAFNTAQGWSRDVSEEIAAAVMEACAKEDRVVPSALEDFINQHRMPWPEQLPPKQPK